MSAPQFVLDSSSDPSTITVNDNGILQVSKTVTLSAAKVDPNQGYSATFDILNIRATAEKGKYVIKVDDAAVFESDIFDIAVGQTLNITKDLPGFPSSDAGKVHKVVVDVYRQVA